VKVSKFISMWGGVRYDREKADERSSDLKLRVLEK
jgi:hypothetical protein